MRKARILPEQIEEQLTALPRFFLGKKIEEKLSAVGVEMPENVVAEFVEHILSQSTKSFSWDSGGPDTQITLSLSEEDLEECTASVESVLSQLPEILRDTSESFAGTVFRSLKRDWANGYDYQLIERDGFRARLEARWGRALKRR